MSKRFFWLAILLAALVSGCSTTSSVPADAQVNAVLFWSDT